VAIRRAPVASFTDVLRRKAVLGVLGAEFVSFWGGDKPVKVPRKKTGVTAGWVGEASALSESTPEFEDDAASAPKSLGACVVVSRKMWLHAGGEEFQDYLVAEMGAALAAEVDRAGLAGAGTNEPVGLFNSASGIPVASIGANGGPLTRAHLVGAMKAVHLANGDSPATARMGWASNPDVEAKLRLTDGGMGDGPLWSGDDRILGKPAVATTSVPNNFAKGSGTGLSGLAYGNFGDVMINHAPAAYVLINPHSKDVSGDVRITAWLDVRILFRHADSFVKFVDVQTS
jgi:HK97 family phage major capsid protein